MCGGLGQNDVLRNLSCPLSNSCLRDPIGLNHVLSEISERIYTLIYFNKGFDTRLCLLMV